MLNPTDLKAGNFVGGKWMPSVEEAVMQVIDPSTEDVIGEVPQGGAQDVDRAVAAARKALPVWRDTTPGERSAALARLADIIDENREELILLESRNVGKPLAVAGEEIPICADTLRFLGGAARTMTLPASGEYLAGHMSILRREPIGVIAAIAPWNYPLMMAIWKLAPAIATGNTVVLKPSEQTPLTMLRFLQLAEGTLPDGVLNVITGYGDPVGEALATHPDVAMVSLTGSAATGRRVAANASQTLKHVHLELGGKAPVIVFGDADVESLADAVRIFGYWNSGQECGSATRILVQKTAYDDVLGALVDQVGKIKTGSPSEGEDVEMGPLISEKQMQRVVGYIDRAAQAGGNVEIGGGRIDRPGFFVGPTVISDVTQDSEIVQSEVFGPVVTVQPFDDEADAISKANDTEYGLCASVWTKDGGRSLRFARALDFGTVWINAHLALASEMPWGGFKASGYGKDMSALVLEDYTRVKHVMTNFLL